MQSFSSRIWTHVAVSISYDDNDYTTGTPYSPDLAPCDFWLFPQVIGCRYETIEAMKEAVTKVIDTLTQEDLHGTFQKLVERYNKCLAAWRRLLRRGIEVYVCTINKSTHTKKVWKHI